MRAHESAEIRAVVVHAASVQRSLPYFCLAKIRRYLTTYRHGVRAVL